MTNLKNKIWANTWPPSDEPLTFFCYNCLYSQPGQPEDSCSVCGKKGVLDPSDIRKRKQGNLPHKRFGILQTSDEHYVDRRMAQAVRAADKATHLTAVVLLRELIRDIETKVDENGNEYPGTYPYWNSIASYTKAKEFLETQP